MTDSKKMTSIQIRNIIQSLQGMYLRDTPPPDNVIVYPDSVKPVEDEEGFYQATAKITINYVGEKSHKVNLKFRTNKNGRVSQETISYI
jgi:hypothetical protein